MARLSLSTEAAQRCEGQGLVGAQDLEQPWGRYLDAEIGAGCGRDPHWNCEAREPVLDAQAKAKAQKEKAETDTAAAQLLARVQIEM